MKKKILTILIGSMLIFGLTACGSGPAEDANTPSPTEKTETNTEDKTTEDKTTEAETTGEKLTSKENPVSLVGSFDEKLEGPIYLTSIGQSADAAMIDAMMKKIGVEYSYNSLFSAEEMADAKTIIISSGASSKGLGAAGISMDDEVARAEEIMKLIDDNDITVVFAHVGGSARRGEMSDEFSKMVLDKATVGIVVEDGNQDGMFTTVAEEKGIPIYLVNAISDAVSPLEELFK